MDNNKEFDALRMWPMKQERRTEVLTPHKITGVILLNEYFIQNANPFSLPKHRRNCCFLILKLMQHPDLSYHDLHNLLTLPTYGVTADHLAAFEKSMEKFTGQGLDSFLSILKSIEKHIVDYIRGHTFGIAVLYVKRIFITLDKLPFSDMINLYRNIKAYYDKGIRALAIAQPRNDITDIDTEEMIEYFRSKKGRWSVKQADLFTLQQCHLLENNEIDALTPIEMQTMVNEITKDNPLYSHAHILSYMNSVRLRDLSNSLEAFHRAFDSSSTKTTGSQSDAKRFQYSSLNLAILHAQFGHTAEALKSLRECVMLAQECDDRHCLHLAQSWLYHLDKNYVQLNEKNIASQADENLIHSVSLRIQYCVNEAAQSGFNPSKLFDLLIKSEVLNYQYSYIDLTTNCMAQKSAAWTLYGKNELTSLYNQLLLHFVPSQRKRNGEIRVENSESLTNVLCSLVFWFRLQGQFTFSSVILNHIRTRYPRDPLSRCWLITDYYTSITHLLNRQEWDEALINCNRLYTLDADQSELQRSSVCIGRKNLTTSRSILCNMLKVNGNKRQPIVNRIRAMILLSNVTVASENQTMNVIPLLTEAAILARNHYQSYEAALIDVNFSYSLLQLGMPLKALKTMEKCTTTILANGSRYDCAKTLFLFVKCLIAVEPTRTGKLFQMQNSCEDILLKVIDGFMAIDAIAKVLDVYAYIAMFYNDVRVFNERNKYSYKFRQLQNEFSISYEYLNIFH